jgi:hypothetical protein
VVTDARLRRTACCFILSFTILPACSRRQSLAGETEEEPPRIPTTVHMAGPRAQPQLVSGWHAVEHNAWRWTARQFAVVLGSPRMAARAGAILRVNVTVSEVTISRLHHVKLSASIQQTPLAPEVYTKAGDYVYTRDVPAGVFTSDSVRIDFTLDKAIRPGEVDSRELGVVVNRIGLESK